MLTRALPAAALSALLFCAAPVDAATAVPQPSATNAAVAQDLAQLMTRLDLVPANLAAAGCSSSDVSTIAADIAEHLASDPTAIELADDACFEAVVALQEVRAAIRAGEATQAQLDSLPGLEAAHQTAVDARDVLITAAWSAATASLTTDERDALATIRSNSKWSVETYFLVVDRTQAQWLELREALDEQRVAQKFGEDVSAESLTIISNALANGDVAAAKVDLETNLAAVKSAWNSAVAG